MRLPFKIVKNPKLPKVERTLDLEKFYTFKTGENIYTYKIEDLARISGRYLDQVKNNINFMLQYSAGPEQVKAFANNIKAMAKAALEGSQDKTEAIIKIHETAGQMPKLQEYVEDIHTKQWYDLYVMFFVLDGEQETMFTPKFNARKIELLAAEGQEAQEVFFSFLNSLTVAFSDTYRNDLIGSMIKERELTELAVSLTSLTKKVTTTSTSADGQE